jgi:WD40 repeat protein
MDDLLSIAIQTMFTDVEFVDNIIDVSSLLNKLKITLRKPVTRWFASASYDTNIIVWNILTGEIIRKLNGQMCALCSLQLFDGRILSGGEDNDLIVWEMDKEDPTDTWKGHNEAVRCIIQISDGTIITSGHENTIRLWNPNSGACLRTFSHHSGYVITVVQIDSDLVASGGSGDFKIMLWNPHTCTKKMSLEGHQNEVDALLVLQDGRLASAGWDCTIRLWNITTGECTNVLQGHSRMIRGLAQLANGTLVSGGDDRSIRLWDVETGVGEELEDNSINNRSCVNCVLAVKDDTFLTGGDGSEVHLWSASKRKCLRVYKEHTAPIWSVSLLK